MVEVKKYKKNSKCLAKIVIVSFFAIVSSCKPMYNSVYKKPVLVDAKSSKEVRKLHKKLFYLSKEGFAIGHQDATA